LRHFADRVAKRCGIQAYDGVKLDYNRLYDWSIEHPEQFWPEWWRYTAIIAEERPNRDPWDDVVIGLGRMAPPDPALGPRWFPGAKINFAENLLRMITTHWSPGMSPAGGR
jgi:acetoacetyl-CoA synthetase